MRLLLKRHDYSSVDLQHPLKSIAYAAELNLEKY
jgi:hypothetical protein